MITLVGIHGRTDGPLQDADLAAVKISRIGAVKLLSSANPSDVDRLLSISPAMLLVVRCYADFRGRVVTAGDFAHWMMGDLAPFYNRGVRRFEVHNEPNLTQEGYGSSWRNGQEFGDWFERVVSLLKPIFPDAAWGWPGLSPGSEARDKSGQLVRADSARFLEEAIVSPFSADWMGIHAYWTNDVEYRLALARVANYGQRFPGRPIYVTEFSNPSPVVGKADKAVQYLDFYRDLADTARVAFAFVVSGSDANFAQETWRDEQGVMSEIPPIIGGRPVEVAMATDKRARGFDISGDNQLPENMHPAEWKKLGFCFVFIELLNGTRQVPHYAELRAMFRAEGYLTGTYAAVREDEPITDQVNKFLALVPPDDELPHMPDFERHGLKEPMIRAWCDRHDAASNRQILNYTGAPFWLATIPPVARERYKRQLLSIAAYPYDSPETDAQGHPIPQPMDAASVARRSNPPTDRQPPIPPPWTDWTFWQHSGHATAPGDPNFIDEEVYNGTEAELRARFAGSAPASDPVQLALSGTQAARSAVARALELLSQPIGGGQMWHS